MGGAPNRRTPRHKRALTRPLGRRASLLPLVKRLTPRDLLILTFLFEHRVLTIHHVCALFFNTVKVARRRMLILYRLGVVDRFDLPMLRSSPSHYVLDHLGARILAAHRGIEFRQLGWRKEDIEALPWRQAFGHLMATNELLVRLIDACRRDGSHLVTECWGELHCHRAWAETVFPDAYARLEGPDGAIDFFLELDLGTESPSRLAAKLTDYEEVALLENCPAALVFCFPDPEREVAARKRLHNPGITVATTVFDLAGADPLGAVWLPIGSERRVRLIDLPARDDPQTRRR